MERSVNSWLRDLNLLQFLTFRKNVTENFVSISANYIHVRNTKVN